MSRQVFVPDTSVIIDGKVTDFADDGEFDNALIIIAEAVVDELEHQANSGREIGDAGLDELEQIQRLSREYAFDVQFDGRHTTSEERMNADKGDIDALIRDLAEDRNATLLTADRVQARVAAAKDISHRFVGREKAEGSVLSDYFDEGTMSVHLRAGSRPQAKRGELGAVEYTPLSDEPMPQSEVEAVARDVVERAKRDTDGLVEMERDGATVVQLARMRIAITRPPFSDRIEITAVRPVADLDISEYDLDDSVSERLNQKAEGILIAGSPGHGKSTFAQALARSYSEQGNVVKTMEQPRDLDVGDDVTQYAPLEGTMENTGDLLLLVRPDYTVYDEVRKTEDFSVFSDMRLAGVGMIGVVHASEALDAVQRLIGRVELGVIPQIVDTVVYIEDGAVETVYSLSLTVKVPEGMQEADLARPVVLISDFHSGEPQYEIYTYGEETVVLPITDLDLDDDGGETGAQGLARKQLRHSLKKYADNPKIEFLSDDEVRVTVREDEASRLIGKGGETIHELEDELGVSIDVETSEGPMDETIDVEVSETDSSVALIVGQEYAGMEADIYRGKEHLFSATVGKNGQIRVTKQSELASRLLGAAAADALSVVV